MAWLTSFLVLWAIYEHSPVYRISSVPMYHFFIYIPLSLLRLSPFGSGEEPRANKAENRLTLFIRSTWDGCQMIWLVKTNKQTNTTTTNSNNNNKHRTVSVDKLWNCNHGQPQFGYMGWSDVTFYSRCKNRSCQM